MKYKKRSWSLKNSAFHGTLSFWLCFMAIPKAFAYEVRLDTVSLFPGGPVTDSQCHAGTPPVLSGYGPPNCSGGSTGTVPAVSYSDTNVAASANLYTGELKVTANSAGSGLVSLTDVLDMNFLGLGPNETTTIGFDLMVDGTYGRAPGQDRGQAVFSFNAVSGLNGSPLTDQVAGSVVYRTGPGSNIVNSTGTPEEFYTFTNFGDWIQLTTNHFIAEIDISGADPTLTFSMTLNASGPADFGNTAAISLLLPPGTTFTSDSGVFLSLRDDSTNVPEPASVILLGIGLAGLVLLRNPRSIKSQLQPGSSF